MDPAQASPFFVGHNIVGLSPRRWGRPFLEAPRLRIEHADAIAAIFAKPEMFRANPWSHGAARN